MFTVHNFFRIQALTQYDLLKDVSLSALGMYSSCVFARAYYITT